MSDEEIFQSLKHIKVVFDVGAKGTPYPALKPKATYHLFEPNPEHFNSLPKGPNIFANKYGLGDVETELAYDVTAEKFSGPVGGLTYPIKTLNWYIAENKIKRLDFLKIDAEEMDYKILIGGSEAIKLAAYIQYEYWNDQQIFKDLLGNEFEMVDMGLRNMLCTRK